jgi:hypothetical protein
MSACCQESSKSAQALYPCNKQLVLLLLLHGMQVHKYLP